MNCEDVQELLPAYALGLLDPEEQDAVEAHLRECRNHDAELVQLRATSFALDTLGEDVEFSPALRQSVGRITGMPRSRPGQARPRWWVGAAAAVALLVMFAGGWAARSFLGPDSSSVELRYSHALQGANGELVRFSGVEGGDEVTVIMSGLDRLPSGQLYRLWAIRDGQWLRIGQCNTDQEGGWVGDFAFALQPTDELALTIEAPSADPRQPGTPILRSSPSS